MEVRVGQMEAEGRALEAARLRQRTTFDLEMLRELGYCSRRRELLAATCPQREPGLAAVDAAGLLPAGLAADRGRVAHDDPAGRRHVQERPDPQGDPGRLRLPAPVRARQPAADVRGVRGARQPGDLRLGHARPVRARAERADRGAADPAHRHRGPADHGPAHRGPDRRPARGDPAARRARRAGARHDAHQEDGRGPRGLPQGAGRQGPVPPHRGGHARAGRDPAGPAPRRVRRAGGHQPAARGPGPARGDAGRDPRRGQGGLPAQRLVADPDDRPRGAQHRRRGRDVRGPRSPSRCGSRSTRPTAGAPSRSSTTSSTGSSPQTIIKGIHDINDRLRAVAESTVVYIVRAPGPASSRRRTRPRWSGWSPAWRPR